MYGKALPFSVNFGECGKVFPCVIQRYFTTFRNEIWQFYSFSDVLSSRGQRFRSFFQAENGLLVTLFSLQRYIPYISIAIQLVAPSHMKLFDVLFGENINPLLKQIVINSNYSIFSGFTINNSTCNI